MMEINEDLCKSLYSRIEPILNHRNFNCCCVFVGGKCIYFCGACIARRSEYEERWARRHMHAVAAMNGTKTVKYSKTFYNEID